LGLRREHSYNEVVAYIRQDPDKIKFPDRAADLLRDHPIYAQLRTSLSTDGVDAARSDQLRFRQTDDTRPWPGPRRPPPPGDDAPDDPPDAAMDAAADDPFTQQPPAAPPMQFNFGPDPRTQYLHHNGMPPPANPVDPVAGGSNPPPPPPSMWGSVKQSAAVGFGSGVGAAVAQSTSNMVTRGVATLFGAATAAAEGAEAGAAGGLPGALFGGLVGAAAGGVAANLAQMPFQPPPAPATVGAPLGPGPPPPPPAGGASGVGPVPTQIYRPQPYVARPRDPRDDMRNQATRQGLAQMVNQQMRHNAGDGTPHVQVDTRTLNGQNRDSVKPIAVRNAAMTSKAAGKTRFAKAFSKAHTHARASVYQPTSTPASSSSDAAASAAAATAGFIPPPPGPYRPEIGSVPDKVGRIEKKIGVKKQGKAVRTVDTPGKGTVMGKGSVTQLADPGHIDGTDIPIPASAPPYADLLKKALHTHVDPYTPAQPFNMARMLPEKTDGRPGREREMHPTGRYFDGNAKEKYHTKHTDRFNPQPKRYDGTNGQGSKKYNPKDKIFDVMKTRGSKRKVTIQDPAGDDAVEAGGVRVKSRKVGGGDPSKFKKAEPPRASKNTGWGGFGTTKMSGRSGAVI